MPNDNAVDKDTFTTTISVDRNLYDRFRLIAESHHRSPRQEVRALIEQHVREHERKEVTA